jgi:phytoene dehydrogenase-like protein
VTKITVEHGRAIGVQVHDQFVRGPSRGAGRCSRKASLRPAGHLRRASTEGTGQDGRFRRDPGTVKVDYALRGPVPWSAPPPYAPGTVHVSDSYEELVIGQAQLSTGHIPERPFLLVGQMTTADPTRSPEGTESLWAYPHVPQRVLGAAGGNLTGSWDTDEAERFADRMQRPHRAAGTRLLRAHPGASHPDSDRHGASQRESGRRLHQRRDCGA